MSIPDTKTINEYLKELGFDVTNKTDPINPSHYKTGGIETIDYIEAKLGVDGAFSYCLGNVLKYVSRAGKKNIATEREDLEKAQWYLNKALEYTSYE